MRLLTLIGVLGLAFVGWLWWEVGRAVEGVGQVLDAGLGRMAATVDGVKNADVLFRRHPDGSFEITGPGLAVHQLKPGDLDGVRKVLAQRPGASIALIVTSAGSATTPQSELRNALPTQERVLFESVGAVIIQQVVETID